MIYLIIGILILLVAVLIIALVQKSRGEDPTEISSAPPIDCCGAHDVCEADSLLNSNADVIYYEDEELDRFSDRDARTYNDDEVDEFQEVLFTMQETDVAGWLRSLTLRHIDLPSVVKEQALLIVEELREKRLQSATQTV